MMTYMFHPVACSMPGCISCFYWLTSTVPSSLENKASEPCDLYVTFWATQSLLTLKYILAWGSPFFFFISPSFAEHLWEEAILCIVWLVIWVQQILSSSSFYGLGSKVSLGWCLWCVEDQWVRMGVGQVWGKWHAQNISSGTHHSTLCSDSLPWLSPLPVLSYWQWPESQGWF